MTDKDREYYRGRATKARAMAETATDSAVRSAHLEMAASYEMRSAANDLSAFGWTAPD